MSLEIDVSKDGYKILKANIDNKKIYFGSKYNQKREIEKFLSNLDKITEKDNYIVFGLSFAEHIEELLNKTYENSKILIIEFNKELREYCKKDLKVKKILENPRVTLLEDNDNIKLFFAENINEVNVNQLQTLIYGKYLKVYKNELMKTYYLIRDELISVILVRNTGIVSGELRFDNFLRNLKYIAKSTIVNNLREKYENKPAVIVSAGPSLSKNIDDLKNVKNALILSGGRTLATLMERNIMPSAIGIVDPAEVSYKLVENYIDKIDCPLIYNDQIHPEILEKHKEKNFVTRINTFLDDLWDEPPYILSCGGSIAHSLTVLSIYMGCSPIIFVGQDFAYTGEKGHDTSSGNRWNELSFDDYKRDDDIYVEDINGEPIRTSLLLNDYKKSMEEIVAACPEIEFINATEGGANIKGAKNEKLSEVLNRLDKEEVVKLSGYLGREDKTEIIIGKLEASLKSFKKYIKLCEKATRLLKDYKQSYNLKNDKKLYESEKALNKVDQEIRTNLEELYILNFALSRMIYEVESNNEFVINKNDSEKVMFKKNVERSAAIYTGIKDIVKECYNKIDNTIEELKENSNGK